MNKTIIMVCYFTCHHFIQYSILIEELNSSTIYIFGTTNTFSINILWDNREAVD